MQDDNRNNNVRDPQKIGSLRGIAGLVSFSTILPLNIHTSIEEMAKFTWFWPVIGGFIGIIAGTFGFFLLNMVQIPQIIAAALIYSFMIWFNGFHHLDGLMDFGDGMMVHGTPEKKIEVMRDTRIGTGGMAYFVMVALVTFSSLGSAPAALIFPVILVSEVAAKMGIVTCATFSEAFPDGTGRFFIESMNKKFLLLSLVLASTIGFLALNITGIIGIIGGLLGGTLIAFVARRNFKWATGDILGTSNEIGRMLSLIIITWILLV
ncbi:adenosylcobinamide-GDP ribazoletransferase [Methanobacterium aggregans]|uniref:adenosylcobinamide-GDP ribazoletransferase n=1 Tax=Methanobacterium aggregans TaxID=1615586 RepID=UPI001AE2C6B1|nr:adenosylcobinamide-GDP ribazoletransferase [Methanobacterium aggregans]MBP2046249.1 adenosylcobinamide-GDP ribazoletransferase [Methanobacterium aggregans]